MSHNKKISQLYSKSDQLFLQLSAYYKKLMHDHKNNSCLTTQQKKIIKLFNHATWQQYMNWVDQKLEESKGENEGQYKTVLPEIIQQEADLQQSAYMQAYNKERSIKCEHLAISNARLRKDNIILVSKIREVEESLFSSRFLQKQ